MSQNAYVAIGAAIMGAAIQAFNPRATTFDVFAVAAMASGFAYGWCLFVDWLLSRGHKLP